VLELAKRVVKEGERLGFEDVIGIARRNKGTLTRFSNNGVTLHDVFDFTEVRLNVGKEGKKLSANFELQDSQEIYKEMKKLPKLLEVIDPLEVYAPLPSELVKYKEIKGIFDKRVVDSNHFEIMSNIIGSGSEERAKSIAGTLLSAETEDAVSTSQGQEGNYKSTGIELNLRAFAQDEASGQGIAVSTTLDKFDPLEATRKACRDAWLARNPVKAEPGKWEVLLAPPVVANLIGEVGRFASAYYVDAGISFLTNMLGKKVSTKSLTLFDWGNFPYGPDSGLFDWEGVPTQQTQIISRGILASYLHNLTTAKRFNTTSTGNAGWVVPEPTNLVIAPGTIKAKDMLKEINRGIYLTSNWYTRYQNYREGVFSSVARDAAFLIKEGEIKNSLKGIRISDTFPTLLNNICLLSKERYWTKWWDAEVPVLAPYMLVRNLGITTPSSLA
jgi:PmbA protein